RPKTPRGGRGDRTGRYGGAPPSEETPPGGGSRSQRDHDYRKRRGAPRFRHPPPNPDPCYFATPCHPPDLSQGSYEGAEPPRKRDPPPAALPFGADGDYRDQDYRPEAPEEEPRASTIVMLRMLPQAATENDVRSTHGCSPPERRLLPGQSRGFAFVEFHHVQDAARWMDANQVAVPPGVGGWGGTPGYWSVLVVFGLHWWLLVCTGGYWCVLVVQALGYFLC
uniref:RRM domain-containing protein n=1 Tax=Anser cygnoides TaxID=8845 RepID=A0A8B9DPN9_ANSCY